MHEGIWAHKQRRQEKERTIHVHFQREVNTPSKKDKRRSMQMI